MGLQFADQIAGTGWYSTENGS